MSRQTVLLLFGGESSEHDVSILSARNVYAACDNEKYQVELCYIDRQGKWWLLDGWTNHLDEHGGMQLVAVPGARCFMTLPGNGVLRVDVILPILHGKNGEDGTVQGLAALLHIPIVGCDTTASALAMDKVLTKEVLAANDIMSADYIVYRKGNSVPPYEEASKKLGLTMFIKPSRSGSSVGVSKVHDESEYMPAIELALQSDERVLIERAINGRELETAVLGVAPDHTVSGVGEIIPGAEFYDYDDKYATNSASQTIANAELDPETADAIRNTSRKVFEVLGCRGLARVDYLLDGADFYVIEVNTMPGFTGISMYPKLWREAGMHYPELIDRLIQSA